ncbi:MAG: exodeoxyribonuclease V subunit gamma, partial [Microthrixaceae bacterium]|nr:exodeoxyribonuclease V subunit gamma [Microthrixaceae bacterium]
MVRSPADGAACHTGSLVSGTWPGRQMLRVHAAEGLRELALDLAEILADPLSDPMASELIAVPTVGMQRWLSLELSRHLGAS